MAVVAFTSGLTWIRGSDRPLAVSCYDGAGPRWLGRFSARFGTPLRVNVLSGVICAVFVMATQITEGNAYKFFTVALNLAISTTLISYLGIFPAAWRLRRQHPTRRLPFRAPALPALTVVFERPFVTGPVRPARAGGGSGVGAGVGAALSAVTPAVRGRPRRTPAEPPAA